LTSLKKAFRRAERRAADLTKARESKGRAEKGGDKNIKDVI